MWIGCSQQYGTKVIVLGKGDTDAEKVIKMAEENEAVVQDGDYLLVVRFPGRPDELYTEDAVRWSCETLSASPS